MSNRTARARSIGLVLILLLAAVGGPFTGSAAAIHNNEQCSKIDALVYEMFSPPGGSHDSDNPCSKAYAIDQAVEDMYQSDANQTHTDIHAAAVNQKANQQILGNVQSNYLNDSENVAWSKAEVALARAYNNGDSKTVAKNKAKQAIADYYTTKQINLIESWNVSVTAADRLRSIAVNETNLSQPSVFKFYEFPSGTTYDVTYQGTGTTTMTLTNGSTRTAMTYSIHTAKNGETTTITPKTGLYEVQGQDYIHYAGPHAEPPTTDYDRQYVFKNEKFQQRWNAIDTTNANLQSEVDVFVNNTWDNLGGSVNATDLISRQTAMFEYGIDARSSGSRDLYNSLAALAMTGADATQLNGTGTMEVIKDGSTYHGLLLAEEAPNGSWTANTSYNASNITGPVWLATTDGRMMELSGEFTTGTISNEAGENIEAVNATKYDYKTSNTSELLDTMQQMTALREEIESRQATGGAGGGGSGGLPSELIIGGAALIGALILMRGENN